MRVAIITTMRNEAPHLVEWVAHTRAAGADDILVFSNDCSDGTETLLDALDRAGALTHMRNTVPDGRTPQWAALKQAADHPVIRAADWIAVLDCDEFINLRPPHRSLRDLIGAVDADADAIVLPWRLFGHNGHVTRPVGLTIDHYDKAIPADTLYPALCRFFKTLYRRDAMQKPGVHRPKQRKGSTPKWMDGSGTVLPADFAANDGRIMVWGAPMAHGLVQLNHYSVRSVHDFLLKRARGLPNHTEKAVDLTYWVERNFNTVHDPSIQTMAAATRAEHARLMAVPAVAAAQAHSDALRGRALSNALRDPETVKLLGRLILASGSAVIDPAQERALVDLYRKALSGQKNA